MSWRLPATSLHFKDKTMAEASSLRRTVGVCRMVVVALVVALIAVIIAFIVVALRLKHDRPSHTCATNAQHIHLDPPDVVPPFHDLTLKEINAVKEFLYDQADLNLVEPGEIAVNSSYVYTFELEVPPKESTLEFLDSGKPQPERQAKVVIFRGDKPAPYIEEYTVYPLPTPQHKKLVKHVDFRFRPLTSPELVAAISMLNTEVHKTASVLLKESYGGAIQDCDKQCLAFRLINPVSSASTGEPRSRKMWFWLYQDIEFFSLNPLDFLVLVDLTSSSVDQYKIDNIVYNAHKFRDLEALMEAYKDGSVEKTVILFPEVDKTHFSSMNRRGTPFPSNDNRPPYEVEPDGKRYSIEGRHITYMEWDFDVRMSTTFGPQIFDIRYQNTRIVYELSLQDILVFYSAHNPAHRFADYMDSLTLIGTRARTLVAGADCPEHSTFLSATHVLEHSDKPVVMPRAFCVFEHNTGLPLRRHVQSVGAKNKFYEGMLDVVFTVRTITTVVNYDYIFDFIFHQNGAIEVKAVPTGFILTSFYDPTEEDYGFRLREHITGNLHHHQFSFKVDMDINGRSNRFETLNVVPEQADNTKWSTEQNAKYSQTKMVRKEIGQEKDAALNYNFDKPKYLTFYNNAHKTALGVPRAYRLLNKGTSKQLFVEGMGQEPSASWGRYQVAVTKYKEAERRSSSIYAVWDAEDPVVNFQEFIDDNESITDEDQVTWVTMGVHHIPHTEDLPVTPTVGLALTFYLLPNNYFPEDAAMGSGDAIRIEPRDQLHVDKGVTIERYGRAEEGLQCIPEKSTFDSDVQQNPNSIFDSMGDGNVPI